MRLHGRPGLYGRPGLMECSRTKHQVDAHTPSKAQAQQPELQDNAKSHGPP